jgi:hypothetical protein
MNELEHVNVSIGLTTQHSFELAQRAAKMLSSSTLVPKEYQGPAGMANCIIALNMSHRMGADPLMVMQNLVVVHGRPTWSSQFLIATFNSCGKFSAMRFEFFGDKNTDDYGCRAYATELSTGEKLYGSDVTIGIAKAEGWHSRNGSKWKTMPDQMLRYRAASWFVRTVAPELSMGLHTSDEIIDAEIKDINPRPVGNATTADEIIKRAQSSVIEAETIPNENIDFETGEINDIDDLHGELKQQILACQTKADIGRLYASLKEPMKSELKPLFKQRQDEINGVTI